MKSVSDFANEYGKKKELFRKGKIEREIFA